MAIDRADVHQMPYSDESADFIISRSTIHHWADPVKAFQEIYRLLTPGGVAIIHEPRRDPHPKALADFNAARAAVGVEPARMDEKFTPTEVKGFLKKAGSGKAEHRLGSLAGAGFDGLRSPHRQVQSVQNLVHTLDRAGLRHDKELVGRAGVPAGAGGRCLKVGRNCRWGRSPDRATGHDHWLPVPIGDLRSSRRQVRETRANPPAPRRT